MRLRGIEQFAARGARDLRTRVRGLEQFQRGGILLDAIAQERHRDDATPARSVDDIEPRAALRAFQLDERFHVGGGAMVQRTSGASKGYLV